MSKKLFSKFIVLLLVVGLLFAVAPTKQAQAATPITLNVAQWSTTAPLGVAGRPSVLFDGTTYHMWYGVDLAGGATELYYTTATTPGSFPVGTKVDFDTAPLEQSSITVVKEADGFKMIAYGATNQEFVLYTSSDGIAWTKGATVFNATGMDDLGKIDAPFVFNDGGVYKLYFQKKSADGQSYNIYLATSSTIGGTYTLHATNPVLSPSVNTADWDGKFVMHPTVAKDGDTYYMYYSAHNNVLPQRIGLATSPDGINWTKSPANPVIGPVGETSVIKNGATWQMWYLGAGNAVQYVSATGPFEFQTIQAAINAVEAATVTESTTFVIDVAAGEYVENLVINKITDIKNYEIIGAEGATLKGTVTINSNSAYYDSTLLIKGINFVDNTPTVGNAVIKFGSADGTTPPATRYASNITIEDCTFTGTNQLDWGLDPISGSGVKNIVVKNCDVINMHSLTQISSVGITIEGCTFINSARGMNLNQSSEILIKDTVFNDPVEKYAVRVGSGTTGPSDRTLTITGSTLLSAGSSADLTDPETVLVLRGDAPKNIVISNSTISNTAGDCDISRDSDGAVPSLYTLTFTNVNWGTDGMKLCGLAGATIINNSVHNVTQDTWYSTIQAAINAAAANDVIEVGAGTYTENLNITTPLTLQSTDWAGKIVGDINIKSSNVTVQGLDISHPGFVTCFNLSNDQVAVGDPRLTLSDISILNNKIHDVGGNAGGNTKAIKAAHGPDNVTIEGNQFYNITNTVTGGTKTRHTDAISFGDSSASDPSVGVVIRNNTFVNITSARDQANAISFNNNTGVTAIIENNTFEMDTIRGNTLGTLIGLERQVPGIEVRGNTFQATNPANIASNTHAIYTPRSDTVIEKNKFLTTGNMVTAGYSTVVDVTGNWWGQATGPRTGQTVYRLVDTNPWCANAECTEFLPAAVTIAPVSSVVCGNTTTSTIEIDIAGIPTSTPLQAYSFYLEFDATKTSIKDVFALINGDATGQNGFLGAGGFLLKRVEGNPGKVEIGYTAYGVSTSVGGGNLLSIELTHLGFSGDIPLLLSGLKLSTFDQQYLIPGEVSTTPVVLTLQPAVLNITKNPVVGYCTLAEAVAGASTTVNETLQLQADIAIPATVTVDKALTLDLNGKTATIPSGGYGLDVTSTAGNLTITDSFAGASGAITGGYNTVWVGGGATFTLDKGSLTGALYGVGVVGTGSTVNVDGGVIDSVYFAITGNGSAGDGGTIIDIDGGAISSDYTAIYVPQAGSVDISAGTISGHTGIEVRSGSLTISGGSITATGQYLPVPGTYSNGSLESGDAIFINTNPDYAGNMIINISGGTFTSATGYAMREYVYDSAGVTEVETLTVTGGTFIGGVDSGEAGAAVTFSTQLTALQLPELALKGGLYNTDPASPTVFVFVPYGTIYNGTMFEIVGISVNVSDFYYVKNATMLGVSAEIKTNNFLFSNASSVTVKLYTGTAGSYQHLQTNVLKNPGAYPNSGPLGSPFNIFGTYQTSSWTNTHQTEYGQHLAPTHVEVTVVVPTGTLTAFADIPGGAYTYADIQPSIAIDHAAYVVMSNVRGVSAGVVATNFNFNQATDIKMEMFAGETLLQTNTAPLGSPLFNNSYTAISGPFDIFGTFEYTTDFYPGTGPTPNWSNAHGSEYGQTLAPTKVVATITLPGNVILTLERAIDPSGRPSILPMVNGLVYMQGRFAGTGSRLGVPLMLKGADNVEHPATSSDLTDINYGFAGLELQQYTFTTNQPRYLNIPAGQIAFTVTGDITLKELRLRAGNAMWTNGTNVIDLDDAGKIGTDWNSTFDVAFLGDCGDVNFDGLVNIQDLALVGGNYMLTSADAYGTSLLQP